MKYLYIVQKYKNYKRGAWTASKALESKYPEIQVIDAQNILNINDYRNDKTILIFPYQNMEMYKNIYNKTKQYKTDIVYTRYEDADGWFNSCSNGFSYWKQSTKIKKFIPHNINLEKLSSNNPNQQIIGFYCRPYLIQDSYLKFIDFVLKFKLPKIIIMGVDKSKEIAKRTGAIVEHTYDNQQFFNKISHYYYFKSNIFIDPFPHTIHEALMCNKQIIIEGEKRIFYDGIDDIESCIDYHKTLNNKIYDNKNNILLSNKLEKFYDQLIYNNFEYHVDKYKYKTFYDWLSSF